MGRGNGMAINRSNESDKAKALATTEVDISQIEPGKSIDFMEKPVFKKKNPRRNKEARSVSLDDLPHPEG